MQSDAWIQIALRALPALLVFILGFVAATDKSTRDRWNNILYQVGSIRPDQREDVKTGKSVKWPFFVMALLLLIWPVQYYRLATRVFEIKSDIYSAPRQAPSIYDRNAGNATTDAAGNTVSGETPAPSTPAQSNGSNIYGQPR